MAAWFLLAVLAASPAYAKPADMGKPLDCAHTPYFDSRMICDNPELLSSYEQVQHAYRRAEAKFTGADLKIFRAGQRYWSNGGPCFELGPDGKNRPQSWEIQCLKGEFARRLDFLRALESNPSSLKSTVATYDYIDPWYLKLFAKEYEGKPVNLYGMMEMGGCKDETAKVPHPAKLVDDDGHVSIPIRFKILPEEQIWLLCERHPTQWWPGTVRLDHGRPYIDAERPVF